MHERGSVKRLPIGAAPRTWRGLRACLLGMVGVSLVCAAVLAAPATKPDASAKSATAQAKDTAPGDFVGSEVCATCHEDVAKGFAANPHTRMTEMHGSNGATCENCHGAGKAHVEGGGDVTKIFNPSKASAKEIDATCLKCHSSAHPTWVAPAATAFTRARTRSTF